MTRQQTIKAVYEDPRTGFGSIDLTWRLARARDRTITRQEVASYINGLRVQRDRPQRGYNSYVPPLPMHQLQIDLADMKAFGAVPYPYMFVAVDAFTKKVSAIPLKDKKASNTAQGLRKVISELGIPAHIYSDDGTEFKKEFREALEYWDINKLVTRGHAYFAERMIRTLKEAILRRIAAGVGRRGQWHLLLPDIISQITLENRVRPKLFQTKPSTIPLRLMKVIASCNLHTRAPSSLRVKRKRSESTASRSCIPRYGTNLRVFGNRSGANLLL